MGTPDYIAPRAGDGPARADIRADIYSLGCTLYFLLAASPLPGEVGGDKLVCHQSAEPTPIEKLVANLPTAFPPVLRKMMAKSPQDASRAGRGRGGALYPFCRAEVIIGDYALADPTSPNPFGQPNTRRSNCPWRRLDDRAMTATIPSPSASVTVVCLALARTYFRACC